MTKTLEGIIQRTCNILDVPFTDDGAKEIAKRARGTPRIANNLINFCRDYAMQKAMGSSRRYKPTVLLNY